MVLIRCKVLNISMSTQSFVHHPTTLTSTEETFLQSTNPEDMFLEYYLHYECLQPHHSVLPAVKEFQRHDHIKFLIY